MKNILVCAVSYDSSSNGAYHFSRYILELNNLSDAYCIWILTEDIAENNAQRNEKSPFNIIKVPFNSSSFLFPFFHFLRNWAYYRAIRRFQKEKKTCLTLMCMLMHNAAAR